MPETAALIIALILERPMCISCIATKAMLPEAAVETSLARVAPVVQIRRELDGRCRACRRTGIVLWLTDAHAS